MRTKLTKRATWRQAQSVTPRSTPTMWASPSGSARMARSPMAKYRFGGRQRWFTIGRHGSPWTPDSARKEALRVLGEVAHGFDPAEKRAVDRRAHVRSALRPLPRRRLRAQKGVDFGTDRGKSTCT